MVFFKSLKLNMAIIALTYIGCGFLLCVDNSKSISYVLMLFIAGLFVVGLLSMISYFLMSIESRYKRNDFVVGAVLLSISFYIYYSIKLVLDNYLTAILGLAIILSGVIKLQDMFDAKAVKKAWKTMYLYGALICVILGALVILNPFSSATLIYTIAGVGMVFSGLGDLISNVYLAASRAKYEAQLKNASKEDASQTEEFKIDEIKAD